MDQQVTVNNPPIEVDTSATPGAPAPADWKCVPPGDEIAQLNVDGSKTVVAPPVEIHVTSTIRLDYGCGKTPRKGFIGVDHKLGGEFLPTTLGDGTTFADNSVEEIYASHCLEHLGHWQARDLIREWCRVLKPGGRLRVAVPDMRKIFFAYTQGHPVNVGGYTWGGQTDEDDYHKTGFDEGLLRANLEHFGFEDVKEWKSDLVDCASLPISLNLEATKREFRRLDRTLLYPLCGVQMIQSMPRLAFTENMFCCLQVATTLQIPFTRVTGVNWGQCLERAMEAVVAENKAEWILTCDYDSVFTVDHVIHLWNLLFEDSRKAHVTAIAPVEFKREENLILAGVMDESTGKRKENLMLADMEPPLVQVEWAHFGLTFIRTEALRRMKKPWFWETPSPNNDWNEGRTDNDINFWYRMREAGGKVYVCPHVAIGHAQLMAVWPDQEMNPIYQYMSEYQKFGVPRNGRK